MATPTKRALPAALRDARATLAKDLVGESVERGTRRYIKDKLDKSVIVDVIQRFAYASIATGTVDEKRDAATQKKLDVIATYVAAANSTLHVRRVADHKAACAIQAALRYRVSSRMTQGHYLVHSLNNNHGPLRSLIAIMLNLHDSNSSVQQLHQNLNESNNKKQGGNNSSVYDADGVSPKRVKNEADVARRSQAKRDAELASPILGTQGYSSVARGGAGGGQDSGYIRAVKEFEICPLLSPVKNGRRSRTQRKLDDIIRARGGELPASPNAMRKRRKQQQAQDATPLHSQQFNNSTVLNSTTDRTGDIRGLQMLLGYSRESRIQQNKQQRALSASRKNRQHLQPGPHSKELSPSEVIDRAQSIAEGNQNDRDTVEATSPHDMAELRSQHQQELDGVRAEFEKILLGSKSQELVRNMTDHSVRSDTLAVSPTTRSATSTSTRSTRRR